ncbi:MAG TPA: DUF3226 domain-containing protein [Terriglobia bacterium]|nr:DUF3226 domain-containing protein [Terriglobia bacterium]
MGNSVIKKAFHIVCEGRDDKAFFTKLFEAHGIQDFEAECARTNNDPKRCAGKSGITDTLLGLKAVNDLNPGILRGIIIAVDSDEDPAKSFESVRRSIKETKMQLPVPDQALIPKLDPQGMDPAIAILSIPWIDQPGHLDSLLFDSMQTSHADLIAPIEDFCDSTEHRTRDWAQNNKSKMKLRCAIAASKEGEPGLSLAYFLESSECEINFKDVKFNKIVNFIKEFSEHLNGKTRKPKPHPAA